MKCEICKNQEATVHFKQVTGDEVRELWVCRACAEERGLDLQSPVSLTDFFFGTQQESPPPIPPDKDIQCAACKMKLSDFRRLSRLGCPACYEAFSEEMDSVLAQLQDGDQHMGKVPAREQVRFEIAGHEDALARAVDAQNFEEAAKLRDRLHELRARAGKPGVAQGTGGQDHGG